MATKKLIIFGFLLVVAFALLFNAFSPNSETQNTPIQETRKNAPTPPQETPKPPITQTDTKECGNIIEFRNRSWFISLETLFKSIEFRSVMTNQDGEDSKRGNLSDYDYLGEGCLLSKENFFVFAHLYGLYSYNIRTNTLVGNSYPYVIFEFGNTGFGEKGDNYIEIRSGGGDGLGGVSYYATYFFIDNTVQLHQKCKLIVDKNKEDPEPKDSLEECEKTKKVYR